ncbi:hypothetical protein ScPMuIL_012751 [Solemya velum]
MFIKGGNTSQTITEVLKELYALKKQDSVMYKRKNIFRPFEDETSLEFFSKKTDSSLFCLAAIQRSAQTTWFWVDCMTIMFWI